MIAYRVVAVPERLDAANRLAKAVGGDVVLDTNHEGTFFNHIRALGSAGHASHVVVLEDDAIPCADFAEHVRRLIEERPTHLLGLYVGRAYPPRRQPLIASLVESKPAWLDDPKLTDALRWAVGYVMPTADIADVLDRLAAGGQHRWLDTDKRIGKWHAEHGRLSYPYPSPVNHDDTVPSTATGNKHGRVAWAHCGTECS